MPFDRPTLPQIIERIQADIEGRLGGTDPRLRRSVLGVVARAESGVAHGLHGHIDWIARQIIPDKAEAEILDRWAAWWKVPRKQAAPATGSVTYGGTDGSILPAGAVWQRSDGVEYATDTEATIAGGTALVAITAVAGGQDTNATAGVALTLVTPVAGVQSRGTVAAGGLTGGADIETDESLRGRLRDRVQKTPQGGSLADYELWAKEVAGVTRVWPMEWWLGKGTVGVFFVRDDDTDLIPDAAEVQTVQDHIDVKRPMGADVTVIAPVAVPVAMTISLAPNTSTVQAAVTAALADLFRCEAEVEDGAGRGTILISHIDEAISLAADETDHALVTPAADVTFGPGEIGTLGVLTFQAL
ncbi:MAG: baseplate J/gp47 family protein [Desulfobulbia bacterium]